MGFSPPQGRHVAPINVKFGMRERTRSTPIPNFTFIDAEMWEYSLEKMSKFRIFSHKFTPQGRLVCYILTIFSAFVRVYRYLLSF